MSVSTGSEEAETDGLPRTMVERSVRARIWSRHSPPSMDASDVGGTLMLMPPVIWKLILTPCLSSFWMYAAVRRSLSRAAVGRFGLLTVAAVSQLWRVLQTGSAHLEDARRENVRRAVVFAMRVPWSSWAIDAAKFVGRTSTGRSASLGVSSRPGRSTRAAETNASRGWYGWGSGRS